MKEAASERAGGFGDEERARRRLIGDWKGRRRIARCTYGARGDEAGAGRRACRPCCPPAIEAEHELAELLPRASKGVDVTLGGGWGAARPVAF